MNTLDPLSHDDALARRGAMTLDRPSWLRAHVAAVSLIVGTLLTLFALFAIHR